jgi:hypothetical protein
MESIADILDEVTQDVPSSPLIRDPVRGFSDDEEDPLSLPPSPSPSPATACTPNVTRKRTREELTNFGITLANRKKLKAEGVQEVKDFLAVPRFYPISTNADFMRQLNPDQQTIWLAVSMIQHRQLVQTAQPAEASFHIGKQLMVSVSSWPIQFALIRPW